MVVAVGSGNFLSLLFSTFLLVCDIETKTKRFSSLNFNNWTLVFGLCGIIILDFYTQERE